MEWWEILWTILMIIAIALVAAEVTALWIMILGGIII